MADRNNRDKRGEPDSKIEKKHTVKDREINQNEMNIKRQIETKQTKVDRLSERITVTGSNIESYKGNRSRLTETSERETLYGSE